MRVSIINTRFLLKILKFNTEFEAMNTRTLPHKTLTLLTTLALLGAPVYAQAASPPTTQAPKNPKATGFYNKGVAATQVKDWQTARKAFAEAWKLSKHYQVAANLGWAEYELKLYRDAAEHLDYFLKNTPDDVSSKARMRIHDMFQQARQHIGALHIQVNIPGAEIFVNKRSIGVSPLKYSVFVEPGKHSVEADKEGYKSIEPPQSFEVQAGAPEQEVSIKLEKDNRLDHLIYYGGGALAVGGAIATAWLSGLAERDRSVRNKEEEIAYNSCPDDAKSQQETCKANFLNSEASTQWQQSANRALGFGIGTGVIAAGILTYWLFTRESTDITENKKQPPQIQVGFNFDQRGGSASITLPW